MYLIFQETRIIDLHFAVRLWDYLHSNFSGGLHKTIFFHKSAFRPFNVIDFGTNRKRVCDFLLVRHWSYLAPFQRYCRFCTHDPHPYSTLIFGVFPLHQITHIGVWRSINLKLISREITFEKLQPMWAGYQNVTDGQTDRQIDDILWHRPIRALRSIAPFVR